MKKSLELIMSSASQEEAGLMPIDIYMPYPIDALIINCQSDVLPKLEKNLSHARNFSCSSTTKLTEHVSDKPDDYNVLLLVLPNEEDQAAQVLKCAASYGVDIILLGQNTPQTILRLAFQHGVCDFIGLEAPAIELLEAIKHISTRLEKDSDLAPLIAVFNGKGGSGASFIATSLAEICAGRENCEVAMIDADLHYGTLAHMIGVKPSYFITDALENIEQLDAIALSSAMTSKAQIHLLAARPFSSANRYDEIAPAKFKQLLWKCRQHYSQVIIDLSRGLEFWNASVLEDAEILLVLQQNVMSIRETKALIEQLTIEMGISQRRIHLLVNRYQKSGVEISLNDIRETTGIDSIWVVTNDFKVASQCTDLGTGIVDIAKRRPIYRDLNKITNHFSPQSSKTNTTSSGIWSRLFGRKV